MGSVACPALFMRPCCCSFINLGANINKKGYTITKKVIYLRTINNKGYFMMYLKLKEFFEKNGISQQEIAAALGVSPPYVNAILNGKKPLGKRNAERLANLYGLSKSFLLTGDGDITEVVKQESGIQHQEVTLSFEKAIPAATAYANKTIEALEGQIEEKDKRIKLLEMRIEELEAMQHIDANRPMKDYPFKIGTAEPNQL